MYVIKKGDFYVAMPGQPCSYVKDIEKARLFRTEDEAVRDCCGNETVIRVLECSFCGYRRELLEDEMDDHICAEMDRQLYGIDM